MFEKFGEFDSAEEINRAAKAQLEEGDKEAIEGIAMENGLDQEDVEDFCTGTIEELTTPVLAALGKLDVEAKELGLTGMMEEWKNLVEEMCTESEEMSIAVRRKGKRMEEVLGMVLKAGFDMKIRLNDRITKAAGLNPPIYLGIPGKAKIREIVREYYLGEKK